MPSFCAVFNFSKQAASTKALKFMSDDDEIRQHDDSYQHDYGWLVPQKPIIYDPINMLMTQFIK